MNFVRLVMKLVFLMVNKNALLVLLHINMIIGFIKEIMKIIVYLRDIIMTKKIKL